MREMHRLAPEPSPWGLLAVVVSLGFLAGGILWPGIAATLLRVLVALLALGWAAARALGIGLPASMVYDTNSPFERGLADLSPPSIPDVVRRRARELSAADDPDSGSSRPIPWLVAGDLIHEAARRLEKGHGLRLDNPADAARIRPMMSEITWTLLGLEHTATTRDSGSAEARTVPLARMDDILDDLEKL